MTDQISLLAVYDKVAAVDTKVEALMARMGERLDSGQRKMDDHESRLRVLEAAHDQGKGRTSMLTILLSLAGSATASALISYLLTRH